MIPAPAFYGGIFSLQSYSDHVYQKIVCAIGTNPKSISVTGYSMGGAALTLALDKANTEGVFKEKNIEVKAKIINTFGSLTDVISEQESLIPVLTFALYIFSIPFLVLACINPTQIPNIFLILFSTPLLLTAYLITSILESITASVEHIFAPLKPSKALGKISKPILSIMADFLLSLDPNNPNVLEAATRLISEPSIPNLSFQIYQASDDQVIPEGARLGNNKELKDVTTTSPGGHNSMPYDATSMLYDTK